MHYEVMGIALAIRGHNGECDLFQELDQALAETDWRRMAIIQHAFDLISEKRKAVILSDGGSPRVVAHAITIFEQNLRMMLPQVQSKSA